jgi:hypothetical protein
LELEFILSQIQLESKLQPLENHKPGAITKNPHATLGFTLSFEKRGLFWVDE